uniref:Uncharacterized protein n=1 Tax=Cacopsylla melanoneura TaxID=428564 RepID=A0A8D9AK47_9HEMI
MLKKIWKFIKNLPSMHQDEKVTKFLYLQLTIITVLGLFNLPGTQPSVKYVPSLYKIYMGFTFGFFGTFLTLWSLCAAIKASKDFVEFFLILYEVVSVISMFVEIIFLSMNRVNFLKLLGKMKKFDVTTYPIILIKSSQLEHWTMLCYVGSVFMLMLVKCGYPFFTIDEEECNHIQEIYGYKYPQNRLPICVWIPYVDTSEPRWFIPLYILELHVFLLSFASTVVYMMFPFIILHLVGQHIVLSYNLHCLGKSPMGTNSRQYHSQAKKSREVFQVRKCIVFHQRLLDFRAQVCCPLCFQ